MNGNNRRRTVDARSMRKPMCIAVALLGLSMVGGCSTLGPMTIRTDRFNYNQAAAESSNEQLLLNIVLESVEVLHLQKNCESAEAAQTLLASTLSELSGEGTATLDGFDRTQVWVDIAAVKAVEATSFALE